MAVDTRAGVMPQGNAIHQMPFRTPLKAPAAHSRLQVLIVIALDQETTRQMLTGGLDTILGLRIQPIKAMTQVSQHP